MESISIKTCLEQIDEARRERYAPAKEGARRAKRVLMAPEFLFKLITEGSVVEKSRCIKGIPPGARLTGSYFDPAMFHSYLIFEHDSFPEVEMGAMLPELDVAIEAL